MLTSLFPTGFDALFGVYGRSHYSLPMIKGRSSMLTSAQVLQIQTDFICGKTRRSVLTVLSWNTFGSPPCRELIFCISIRIQAR